MSTDTPENPSEYRVTSDQLRTAKERLERAKEEIERFGKEASPTPLQPSDNDDTLSTDLKRKVKDCGRAKVKYHLFKMLASPQRLTIAWLTTVFGDILLFLVVLTIFRSVSFALLCAFITGVLIIAFLVIAKAQFNPSEEDVTTAYQGWQSLCRVVQTLEERIQLLRCQADYTKAVENYERLHRIADSQRYKLLHIEWRSLRAVPFEDFVGEVFELLGYRVEKTKASGDQGIDIIAEGNKRRIGVQCKGYESSVGNSAVQEAYAGKAFYGCNSCAVITNSVFTRGANELAAKLGCILIDENRMVSFIMGEVF
jgi:hypothetical protein